MSTNKHASLLVLYKCMKAAIKKKGEYGWLISKCTSQSSLAAMERKGEGILAMSLNTFKKYANEVVPGGFDEIDDLRRALKSSSIKLSLKSRKNAQNKEKSTKLMLEESERFRAILLKAYSDLNRICLDAISRSPEFEYDYQKHSELYSKYLGLRLVDDNE